ncbi:two-component system sensor histidine kinase KdpD [uncultured Thiodictyon sp.]|uniref:two-component system sensor histidine kinase KdpD n=1 Tax=uncultured Thiodictyon sp. TaxID=1846217 RepID=UPI0025E7D6BE|nr:two-component system sensor histidine kinase KdpD [uncultured Thiodictyon sp.]
MNDARPNPDALLERVQREEDRARRGRLKVFFGGCAGVGKTYAMLAAAQEQRAKGVDLVVGVAETHGRAETAQLLEGLTVLPPRPVAYRGRQLGEFDLDGALARRPALILIDELAHSNLAGSRHPKRWQDVEELLAAGIDCYTTLNVQHLESLNDVVGQITGVRVRETVPDRVFDLADEVTLVDLPPDELLQRLQEGKVYLPDQAARAADHFFRKGNLLALRELALRRTADRVDVQMRDYRADQSISQVWQAKERLMVCVGPDPGAERLVRSAARLAAGLHADWLAVYVETPRLQRLPAAQREGILKTLKLAQDLGAEGVSLSGVDLVQTLLAYARGRNVSKLVVGRSGQPLLRRLLRPSPADRLVSQKDMDVYIVGDEDAPGDQEPPLAVLGLGPSGHRFEPRRYLWAVAICVVTTGAAAALTQVFDLANVIMLYLLGVVLVAIRWGRGPGVLASVLSVVAFDFFFVSPHFSLTVADTQYLFTFALMLVVALTISHLTASLRFQARVSGHRERRAQALFEAGRALSSALTAGQIVQDGSQRLASVFQSRVLILLPDSQDRIHPPLVAGGSDPLEEAFAREIDLGIAQWVYDHEGPAGLGTDTLPANPHLYLPLRAPMRTRGVLAVAPADADAIFQPEQRRLLETFAAQIALALERVHYVEVAQDAVVSMEAERLRNSLLAAISHDLRTPLTGLMGLADTLAAAPDPGTRDLARAIHEEALRLTALVTNLLDMARLQSGGVTLKREWLPIEEVVGSALRANAALLAGIEVATQIPADLPLVSCDAVLMERVLSNLLDNAAKYSPPGGVIRVAATVAGPWLRVQVTDAGPGLPPGQQERVFDKFTRGERESVRPGVGLGLAICRAIVEVHGGTIRAANGPHGGAEFSFSLPLGVAPQIAGADLESEYALTGRSDG